MRKKIPVLNEKVVRAGVRKIYFPNQFLILFSNRKSGFAALSVVLPYLSYPLGGVAPSQVKPVAVTPVILVS